MAKPAQTRYTRCEYVLGDVLTDIMRAYMMFSKIPFDTIYDTIMRDFRFRKKIHQDEIGKVETLTTRGFADFDFSLMFKIAKYHRFAMIIPDGPTHGWKLFPQEGDNTIGDNILRIAVCRNKLRHNPNTTLSEQEFSKMFEKYIDIGRRADEHLRMNYNHFTCRIESYKTCSLDKEMEDKYQGEIEGLKKLVELKPRPDTIARTYATKETQTQIENIRANELYDCTSSAILTITGITNADENIEKLDNAKDSLSTENIQLKKVKKGSLVLFLMIRNRLFEDAKMMERELDQFVKCLFLTAGLHCDQTHYCDMLFELEDEDTDTEDSDTEDDLVLQVEIKNFAFETDESISQNVDQFISNVVTKVNWKPHTGHNEVTAILEIVNYDSLNDQISDVQHLGHGIISIEQPVSSTPFAWMNECDTSEKIQDNIKSKTLQPVNPYPENQQPQLYATTRSLSCPDLAPDFCNAQMALETDKWQSFVCQPMYNKSVISIPGIGQRYSERLREHGFVHATQIYMQYLQMDGNHAHFVDWLARLCMPYHHPLNTMYHMENAYAALTEWHRQFRN